MLKRAAQPQLSLAGQKALDDHATALREREDLRPVTVRNYLSDLRQFAAWYETTAMARMAGMAGAEHEQETMIPFGFGFGPQEITTPTITRYREYLQHTCELKPASVNRALISI